MNNIGALIIGKSPRNELNNELNKLGVSSNDIEIRGALDGLKDSEVHLLKPKNLSDHLFTVMPNGNTVTISKESVIEIGAIQIEKFIKDKYKYIILLCTGSFPIWKNKYNIIYSSSILHNFVKSINTQGKIGIFNPLEEQYNKTKELWISKGYDAEVTNLSPEANPNEVSNAIEKMSIFKPRLVVFDCISYKTHTKNHVCSELNIPGVLAISTIANVIKELNYFK